MGKQTVRRRQVSRNALKEGTCKLANALIKNQRQHPESTHQLYDAGSSANHFKWRPINGRKMQRPITSRTRKGPGGRFYKEKTPPAPNLKHRGEGENVWRKKGSKKEPICWEKERGGLYFRIESYAVYLRKKGGNRRKNPRQATGRCLYGSLLSFA